MTRRLTAGATLLLGVGLAAGLGSCSYVDDDGLPSDADMEAEPVLQIHIAQAAASEVDVAVRDRPDSNKVARRKWVSDELTGTELFTAFIAPTADAGTSFLALSCYDDLYTLTGTTRLNDGRLANVDVMSFTGDQPAELAVRLTAGASTEELRESQAEPVIEGVCPPAVTTAFENPAAP